MSHSDWTERRRQTEDRSRREFLKGTAAVTVGMGIGAWSDRCWAVGDPIWQAIPDQTWAVGVPVYLDLANYAASQIGANLLFTLNKALPNGVSLNGSVISGTPTATFSGNGYIATAEDGQILEDVPPANPTDLIAQ